MRTDCAGSPQAWIVTTLVAGRGFKRAGEKTQAKYLSGLTGDERKAREDEIVRRSKLYRADPSHPDLKKPLPGDAKAKKSGVRKSRWTVAYKGKYGEDSGGTPDQVAKDTGIPASITNAVYRRGVGAAKSAGHRPGVTKGQWGLARLYAFVMKAKHGTAPLDHDHDLAIKAGLAKQEESDYNLRQRFHGDTMLRDLLETQIVSEPAAHTELDIGLSEEVDAWSQAFQSLRAWKFGLTEKVKTAAAPKEVSAEDIAAAKVLVQKSVVSTRKFVRSMDNLMSAAKDLADQARKDSNKVKREGKAYGQRRTSFENEMRAMDSVVSELYASFAEGRNAMTDAAKLLGVSTRRSGGGGKKQSVPAIDIASTTLTSDIAKVAALLVPALQDTAEDGATAISMAEGLISKMGEPIESWKSEFEAWVQRFLDFRDGVSHSLYNLTGAVVKRANEMGKRLFAGTESEDVFQIGTPWERDANSRFYISEETVPTDPKQRAFMRMEDAAKRSGLLGMIAATERRVKATTEKAKLQGVVEAIADVVRNLNGVSKMAAAKAK